MSDSRSRKVGATPTKATKKGALTVDAFMSQLDHPFKAEVQAVREIIKAVDQSITEEVKWNAPTFSYKGYLATFNLWAKNHVHLVFHNGAILDQTLGILEGDYPDRRMVYFAGMEEVRAKKGALVKAVTQWVRLMDAKEDRSGSEPSR
ncbi:MAG TPA: DUF1801 domain-containing protein [Candidatus Dormibacteraeota bacterium]|nr:DUF1801 domain-containing protein [Candidatus Dormibacteraeota bacterium]